MFVGLLTGLVAVPYHYLLYYFFHLRSDFFASRPAWYWHIPLFLFFWGILILVSWLVKKMPLITGGGIPQTRGVINGRITYKHPFIELFSKFIGGILAFSAGLSLGREGPSVQIGSYVGNLVSRWTRILKGEQKQLLAAGAGAGLAAAFAAPLASSLIVIESIERFDAPKTAITTLLAGVVAGAVVSMVFPVNPYHLIEVTEPIFTFFIQMKYFLILAVVISICGKFYSSIMVSFKRVYAKVQSPAHIKMLYLLLVAYVISLMQVNLTGGGGRAVFAGAGTERQYEYYVGNGYHVAAFRFFGLFRFFGFAGRQLHPDPGNGRLAGADSRVDRCEVRHHRTGKCKLCDADFHVRLPCGSHPHATYRHCADYGNHRAFRGLLSFGRCGRTYLLLYGTSADEAVQRHPVRRHDSCPRLQGRGTLYAFRGNNDGFLPRWQTGG